MYRLIRFGTTDLEYRNQIDTIGSGPTPVNYFNLPEGGAIDGFGSADKNPGMVERVKQTQLSARTDLALANLFYGLMALRGKRDKLFRRTSQGYYQWQYARLIEIVASRDYQLTRYQWIQDIELHFACQDAFWRGRNRRFWTLNSGVKLNSGYSLNPLQVYALATSPAAVTFTVGATTDAGRAAVRSMQIIVSAGAASMSNVTIARTGGESLTYTGTIPSGGQLIIDTGTMQVSCTGVSGAYVNLTFNPAADMAAWFTLVPGSNTVTITYTGGGTGKAIEFVFNDCWY
jgi:hypothetical protein